MHERDFSKHSDFTTYEYTDDDNRVFITPFPVAVYGINQELLGVGRMVGQTMDNFDGVDGMPVIELDDPRVEGGKVEILGDECWWVPLTGQESLTDETSVITDVLVAHPEDIVPASEYVKTLEAESN